MIETNAPQGAVIMKLVQDAWDAATSKRAQRTAVQTAFAAIASSFVFAIAVVAYIAFYNAYLPDQVTIVPIHLQYGYETNPYGIASLAGANLKDLQDYDISISLVLPRSPANLARGNFMLALYLLDDTVVPKPPPARPVPPTASKILSALTAEHPVDGGGDIRKSPDQIVAQAGPQTILAGRNVIYTAARPTIMPYTDPLISLASRILFVVYHLFSSASETIKITVPMVERLRFHDGGVAGKSMMPSRLVVDVQAGQELQVYSAIVTITAQLSGLRYVMYTWWLTSFAFFVGGFWACAMSVMLAAWSLFGVSAAIPISKSTEKASQRVGEASGVPNISQGEVKREEDFPMTFPTTSGQPPLRYEPPVVKAEADEGQEGKFMSEFPPLGAAAADDGDDESYEDADIKTADGGYRGDSGIGTSYSDRDGSNLLRRRASRGGR